MQVHTTDIGKEYPLEVTPYPLCRVEVRRVGGQYRQLDALGPSTGEPFSHLLSSMDSCSVPHQSNKPWDFREQVVQEGRYGFPIKGVGPRVEVEGSPLTNCRRSRQVISTQPFSKDRSLPFGCPRPHQ